MNHLRENNKNVTCQEPLISGYSKEERNAKAIAADTSISENNDGEHSIFTLPFFRQMLLVSGLFLQKMACGAVLGHTAILLPALMASDSEIPVSKNTASWIVSIMAAGVLVSTVIFPFIMIFFGRKLTEQISALSMTLSWLLIGIAKNTPTLMISRFIQGLSHGSQFIVCSVMVSECTNPVYRGFFLSAISLAVAFGKLYAHLIGTITDWKITAFACSGLSLASLFIIYLIPETPNWLASKGRYEESIESFRWLRGDKISAKKEMDVFINYKKAKNNIGYERTRNFVTKTLEFVSNKDIKKSFFVVFFLVASATLSSTELFATYTINILNEITEDRSEKYWMLNVIDLVRIVSSILGMFIIKKFNGRKVYFTSGISTVSFLALFSVYAYLRFIDYITHSPLLLKAIIYSLVFSFSFGIFPLVFVYVGELFPLSSKELSGFSLGISVCISFFVCTKSAMFLLVNLHVYGTFAVYAISLCLCLIILYFILPETKGKTLVEIDSIIYKL